MGSRGINAEYMGLVANLPKMDNPQEVEIVEGETTAVSPDERQTTPFLTKYERARVLGVRALQISMGAPLMVELGGETDPLKIAEKELKDGKIPITIRRHLPDGSYEDVNVSDLIMH